MTTTTMKKKMAKYAAAAAGYSITDAKHYAPPLEIQATYMILLPT